MTWLLAAGVLCAVGILMPIAAPRILLMRPWMVRFPRTALIAWVAAFTGGVASLICSVVMAGLAGMTVSASEPVPEGLVTTLVAWLALGGAGAVGGLVITAAGSVHAPAAQAPVDPGAVTRETHGRRGLRLVHVPSRDLVAYSLPRPERAIVVPSRLDDLLTPAQLQAVVAHEYAHLRWRHDLILRLAQVNELCLPRRLAVAASFRRAMRLLLELVADDAAARHAGAVHLANALTRVGETGGDESLLLRASRLAEKTWRPARKVRVPVVIDLAV